ncbi:hypothetical protein KCP69_13130 [Salmonella enterica subsp. enterica]|nr:hypothetical protein KCP69_13130 [Salmonella enterica subsp. enterica]
MKYRVDDGKEEARSAAFVTYYLAQGLAGKRRWRCGSDGWGMVTGVGGMWRRCITSSDSRGRDMAIHFL